MVLNGKEYKVYEIYKLLAENEEQNEGFASEAEVEQEILSQNIDLSRLSFKEYRDELIKCHQGYALDTHNGEEVVEDDLYAKQMYDFDRNKEDKKIDYSIGRVVDYDVPVVRCVNTIVEVGNIDLITETYNEVFLINTLGKDSKESLLRGVLESITYYNMISTKRLIKSFEETELNRFKFPHNKHHIVPSIMIYEGTKPYNDFVELKEDSLISKLIRKYSMKVFVLKAQKEYGIYEIKE